MHSFRNNARSWGIALLTVAAVLVLVSFGETIKTLTRKRWAGELGSAVVDSSSLVGIQMRKRDDNVVHLDLPWNPRLAVDNAVSQDLGSADAAAKDIGPVVVYLTTTVYEAYKTPKTGSGLPQDTPDIKAVVPLAAPAVSGLLSAPVASIAGLVSPIPVIPTVIAPVTVASLNNVLPSALVLSLTQGGTIPALVSGAAGVPNVVAGQAVSVLSALLAGGAAVPASLVSQDLNNISSLLAVAPTALLGQAANEVSAVLAAATGVPVSLLNQAGNIVSSILSGLPNSPNTNTNMPSTPSLSQASTGNAATLLISGSPPSSTFGQATGSLGGVRSSAPFLSTGTSSNQVSGSITGNNPTKADATSSRSVISPLALSVPSAQEIPVQPIPSNGSLSAPSTPYSTGIPSQVPQSTNSNYPSIVTVGGNVYSIVGTSTIGPSTIRNSPSSTLGCGCPVGSEVQCPHAATPAPQVIDPMTGAVCSPYMIATFYGECPFGGTAAKTSTATVTETHTITETCCTVTVTSTLVEYLAAVPITTYFTVTPDGCPNATTSLPKVSSVASNAGGSPLTLASSLIIPSLLLSTLLSSATLSLQATASSSVGATLFSSSIVPSTLGDGVSTSSSTTSGSSTASSRSSEALVVGSSTSSFAATSGLGLSLSAVSLTIPSSTVALGVSINIPNTMVRSSSAAIPASSVPSTASSVVSNSFPRSDTALLPSTTSAISSIASATTIPPILSVVLSDIEGAANSLLSDASAVIGGNLLSSVIGQATSILSAIATPVVSDAGALVTQAANNLASVAGIVTSVVGVVPTQVVGGGAASVLNPAVSNINGLVGVLNSILSAAKPTGLLGGLGGIFAEHIAAPSNAPHVFVKVSSEPLSSSGTLKAPTKTSRDFTVVESGLTTVVEEAHVPATTVSAKVISDITVIVGGKPTVIGGYFDDSGVHLGLGQPGGMNRRVVSARPLLDTRDAVPNELKQLQRQEDAKDDQPLSTITKTIVSTIDVTKTNTITRKISFSRPAPFRDSDPIMAQVKAATEDGSLPTASARRLKTQLKQRMHAFEDLWTLCELEPENDACYLLYDLEEGETAKV